MVNLEAFIKTYHSSLSVSCMTWKTPSGKKDTRQPKVIHSVFFFFFSYFFFRRASSNCVIFKMVFTQNSSILHWTVHQPIVFSQLWSLKRQFKPVTEQLWLYLWCFSLVLMHAKRLAMKCNWIRNTIGVCGAPGEALSSIVDFGDLLLCNNGKPQLKHAPATKEVT